MSKKHSENTDPSVRILKTSTCPSLSGKSKLTYQIGYDEKAGIQFKITENSASGAFNPHWFSLKAIEVSLDKAPKGEPVTASNFMSLFRHMSANTPFFVFAAMLHEGLFKPSKEHKRCYDRVDTADFLAEMQPLIEGKVLPQGMKKAKRNADTKVVAVKKPRASTKSTKAPS
jgi:hypothetical protein